MRKAPPIARGRSPRSTSLRSRKKVTEILTPQARLVYDEYINTETEPQGAW